MIEFHFKPDDHRYVFFTGDAHELKQLEEHFNKIPDYQFMPSFIGIPRPVVFIHKFRSKTTQNVIYWCFAGLWKNVVDWCASVGIETQGLDTDACKHFKYRDGFDVTLEEFTKYVEAWELSIPPRDYQIRAAWLILKYRQSCSQIATRAGKTLIAYMVFRWLAEHGTHNILMVVPNTTLVKQAVEDLRDYQMFFKTETVWQNGQLNDQSNLTIGTFQSLVKRIDRKSTKYDPKFFNKFDALLVDECHTAKCESITQIINQPFTRALTIRFGFTGSLPQANTIESYECQSLLGPKIQDIRAKELMDRGYITPIEIRQLVIEHPWTDELRAQYVKCGEYLCGNDTDEKLPKEEREFTIVNKKKLPLVLQQLKHVYDTDEYIAYLVELCKSRGSNLLNLEQMLLHRDMKRIEIMCKLLSNMDKNCIVFAHHTEYINYLVETFKERFPERPVYKIQGSTSVKKRSEIINNLLTDKGAILVASYGCVGTGLTLKNIDYGIFAQSFKSEIINKQAMGRGLCLADDKDKYVLYDLVDKFPTLRLAKQGKVKQRIYKDEKFEYSVKYV